MRSLARVPLLALLAVAVSCAALARPLHAQEKPEAPAKDPPKEANAAQDEQEKEEARLLKKARRHAENEEKAEAQEAFRKLADLAHSREHEDTRITALTELLPLVEGTDQEAGLLDTLEFAEFRQGRYHDALRHVERLAELTPDDSRILNNMGSLYHKCGRDQEAVKTLEHSLELDPKNAIARVSLGRIARLTGKARKALHAHEKLVEDAKAGQLDAGGWFIGFESKKQKKTAKGADFNSAAQRTALVTLEAAVDHAFLDELEEAEKILADARSTVAEADLAPAIEEGIDELERALELRPSHFQLRYHLALLYEAKGDDAASQAELEKFVQAEKSLRSFAKKAKEKLGEKTPEEKAPEKPAAK